MIPQQQVWCTFNGIFLRIFAKIPSPLHLDLQSSSPLPPSPSFQSPASTYSPRLPVTSLSAPLTYSCRLPVSAHSVPHLGFHSPLPLGFQYPPPLPPSAKLSVPSLPSPFTLTRVSSLLSLLTQTSSPFFLCTLTPFQLPSPHPHPGFMIK